MNRRNAILSLLLGIFAITSSALAIDLHEAKRQGLVGETISGYLEAVKTPASPQVQALIKDVNRKRKKKYQQISKKNGTNLPAVEMLAGKKALSKTAPGNYVKEPGGGWIKK